MDWVRHYTRPKYEEQTMTFLYPQLLWFLIPLVFLLWQHKRNITLLVHILVLTLVLIALSRPVEKLALQEAQVEAKDIIIALDVSYSMHANDLTPTRYDFAKATILSLLEKNPTDNIRLVAFTSNPLLLSPPTTDHALIAVALQSLNLDYILTKGTSLKKLFKKLTAMQLKRSNLLLITDGGEENDLPALQGYLEEANINLTVLALGSTAGTSVKKEDGTLLKDKEGNLVISRINPLLEKLASAMKGYYFVASSSPEATANALYEALNKSHSETQIIQKMQSQHVERYQFPLALALLLFLLLHTRGIKVLLVLVTFFGLQAEASILDDYHLHKGYDAYVQKDFTTAKVHFKQVEKNSLERQMALANTYYKLGAFKKAIQTYKSIHSSHVKIKQQIYYNIANAYAMLQTYDKAKIYYTKTLQLGKDRDAKNNLRKIALLANKDDASLGIAHPKSQNSDSSKSESQEQDEDEKEKNQEDQPSSGSGGGGENSSSTDKQKKKQKGKLLLDETAEEQPLGSKAYDLINKGYIRETTPW